MKSKPKKPRVPRESHETTRHRIITVLTGRELTAREISGLAGVREREVAEHLEHIEKSLGHDSRKLVVRPAECLSCGFEFRKRTRFETPGKCPVCKSIRISPPMFIILEEER